MTDSAVAVQEIGLEDLMGGEVNGYVMGQILYDIMEASCQLSGEENDQLAAARSWAIEAIGING